MQTFSNMQRNRSAGKTLKDILLLFVVFAYECVVSFIPFLPPLLGIFFLMFFHFDTKDDFSKFLCILCGIFSFEILNSMPNTLLLVLFLILHFVIDSQIEKINDKYINAIIKVVAVYGGYFMLIYLWSKFFGFEYVPSILIFCVYAAIECALVVLYEHFI